jgi:hypothetical protein
MAYNLIGTNPKSCTGICIRLNIWKWYEFVRMLKYFNIISESEFPLWMTNDQVEISEKESKKISKNIKLNLDSFNKFIKEIYKENIPYSFMPWHREVCCPILNGSDLKYVLLFLDNCGGFKVE